LAGLITFMRLDLDYVGSVVGEQLPGVRTGHPGREFEDADSVEQGHACHRQTMILIPGAPPP
jgi:hypothetical protein